MLIREREAGDLERLRRMAAKEKVAKQKDMYMVVIHAASGVETSDVQRMLQRSRGFVQRWAYAYREGGIEALKEKPRPGRRARLSRAQEEALKARIDAGPTPGDGICTLRGKDVQRIIEQEFGIAYCLNGVYKILHRLNYSCLAPRPRHEKSDPEAMERFKESAPLL